jgi:sugar (pentulose or hexulose) kinase
MVTMRFLALDIGSSFIKGAVLDAEKLTIEHVTRLPSPEPIAGLPAGYFEIDPRLVMSAVHEVLEKVLAQAPDAAGVQFSSQMGGVILADSAGTALTNYISWRDQRTTQQSACDGTYLEVIRRRLGEEGICNLGQELRAGSPLAILDWLQNQGFLLPKSVPLSLGDFVLQQLCEHEVSIVDRTLALGLLDLSRNDWNYDTLSSFGLDALDWPDLGRAWEPTGIWRRSGREIPCYPPIGDHQAALAGALLQSGELSLNISTGSQISLLTDEFIPGDYQTRPYLDARFLNTITHLPAGRSLDVIVTLVNKSWPEIVKAAEAAPDTDLAVDLAFFEGPLGSRGNISNISTDNLSVGTLFRAAFRNMAENYATCAARLSPGGRESLASNESPNGWTKLAKDSRPLFAGTWDRIVFSGGLAQKLPLLRQFILEQLPGESRLCSSAEDTLLGLLVISQVISGRAKDLQEASRLVSAAQGG